MSALLLSALLNFVSWKLTAKFFKLILLGTKVNELKKSELQKKKKKKNMTPVPCCTLR
jgi:hypothetical protein